MDNLFDSVHELGVALEVDKMCAVNSYCHWFGLDDLPKLLEVDGCV